MKAIREIKNYLDLDWRLKKYWTKCLTSYDDRYIKTKIRTDSYTVYTNFSGLYVPEDDIECVSFTVISIDYLIVYKNKYSCKYI